MLSWKLWQALKNPVLRSPLIRHRNRTDSELPTLWDRARHYYLYAMLLGAAFIVWHLTPNPLGFVPMLILLIPAAAILLFLISPLLFALIVVATSARWSADISKRVVEQQESGIYDLLCMLPGGQWDANWATVCDSIKPGASFEVGWFMLRSAVALGILLLGLLLLPILFGSQESFNNIGWFMLDMTLLLIGQLVHHVQTIALIPLVGLLIPTYIHRQFEARLSAVILYLVLQLAPYLLCALLFSLVPIIPSEPIEMQNSVTPYLLVLFGLREAIIMSLWIVLLRRLKLTALEKQHLWNMLQAS